MRRGEPFYHAVLHATYFDGRHIKWEVIINPSLAVRLSPEFFG